MALNIKTVEEAEAVAQKMAKLAPDVLVERMVTGAVAELIIGLKSDPQFGLALVIGAGGIVTELLKDGVTLLLPTSREEITRALNSVKVWKLVEGFRLPGPAISRPSSRRSSPSRICQAHRTRDRRLDVNPLLVLPTALLPSIRDPYEEPDMTSPITTERHGAVLEVTIDRPKANAIDAATSRIMGDVFAEFRDDPELRVAILTAAGDKFFCPGWDLKAAAEGEAPDADYGVGGFGGLQELPGLNKPVISAVNGWPSAAASKS